MIIPKYSLIGKGFATVYAVLLLTMMYSDVTIWCDVLNVISWYLEAISTWRHDYISSRNSSDNLTDS